MLEEQKKLIQEQHRLEQAQMYKDNTVVANVYEIGGVKYTVVSHYVGEKDIDDVILKLAESSAYADMDAASA